MAEKAAKKNGLGPTIQITLHGPVEKNALDALCLLMNKDRRSILVEGIKALVEKGNYHAAVFDALVEVGDVAQG